MCNDQEQLFDILGLTTFIFGLPLNVTNSQKKNNKCICTFYPWSSISSQVFLIFKGWSHHISSYKILKIGAHTYKILEKC